MTWRESPQSWTRWAFVALACIGLYSACESLCACTSSQRRAVVHVVADNCERLELPEPVCVAVEDLAPFLAVLLLAQREGRDAEVEVRDGNGVSHVLVVPLAAIPTAVGKVSGAAVGAANRGVK
jgi:hypothetical protein